MKYIIFSDVHDDTAGLDYIPLEKGMDFGYIFLGDLMELDANAAKANIERLIDLRDNSSSFICVYGTHEKPLILENGSKVIDNWKELAKIRAHIADKARKRGDMRAWEFYKGSSEYLDLLSARTLEIGKILEGSDPKYMSFLRSMRKTESFSSGVNGEMSIQVVHDNLPIPIESRPILRQNKRIGITGRKAAGAQFGSPDFTGNILLLGHSHVPAYYRFEDSDVGGRRFLYDAAVQLDKRGKYILNPGSLKKTKQHKSTCIDGEQKRREARSYAILDTERSVFEVKIIQ